MLTKVKNFYDHEEVIKTYEKELKDFLIEHMKANDAIIFDYTRRSDAKSGAKNPDGLRGPADRVHADYTDLSGPQRAKDVLGLDNYNKSSSPKLGFFTYADEPPPINSGRKPGLKALVESTLDKLKDDKKPFFLMVEGSQIDWGGHANELSYVISEFKDFNNAISSVLKFAKNDGNTLIVVTADHETGGLALKKGNLKKSTVVGDFTTIGHSGTMVPVFSFGPNAELFTGIYENTAIFSKLKTTVN